jgi:tetratricopeptide (TPR) repeat protein
MSWLGMAAAASVALAEPGESVPELLARGDAAARVQRHKDALALFQAAERIAPQKAEVLVRVSEQASALIDETHPESAAHGLAKKSLDAAQRAVAAEPGNARAHLSLAIAHGQLTDFVGSREKLESSKALHAAVVRALELDPGNDRAWHVLGRWHFGFARINPVLASMARIVYGRLPAASLSEARRCLQKACQLAPQKVLHHAELARFYTATDQSELARAEWKIVTELPALTKDDAEDKSAAQRALANPLNR